MRRLLLAATGIGVLAVGLLAAAVSWNGQVSGANAMSFLDPIGQMHTASHNMMHGGSDHRGMHGSGTHQHMHSASEHVCPQAGSMIGMMHNRVDHSGCHFGDPDQDATGRHQQCPRAGMMSGIEYCGSEGRAPATR